MFYIVIDLKTNTQIGKALKSLKAASIKAEKLNLEYGAHRYTYKAY